MSYLFLIARRLLFKRRSSLITASLAVAAMIFLITFNDVVFSGVFSAVERDLINFQYGDVVIQNEQQQFLDETDSSIIKQLARNPGVEASAPRITVIAYEVNYRVGGQTSSVYRVPLTGVDTWYEPKVTRVLASVVEGDPFISTRSVLVGENVAEELGVDGPGRTLELVLKTAREETRYTLTVEGIISTPVTGGLNDFVVADIDLLRGYYGLGDYSTSVIVKVEDPGDTREVIDWIKRYYPDYDVLTAEEAAGWLAQASATTAFINLVGYAGMVASGLAVITVLTMIVSGKTRDIGVLRSIGVSKREIVAIFMLDGVLIGVVGGAMGALLSGSIIYLLDRYPIAFFGGIVLEVKFSLSPSFLLPILVGFLTSILASIYPAIRASSYEPAEAIKYV
jgi:lipoprotein-releasing system permease protein